MPSNQDVRFIRRHGRVIPIRINREKASRNRGASLMGAGAVAVAGSAAISAGLAVSASNLAKRSGKLLRKVNSVFKTDSSMRFISPSSVNRGLKMGIKGYKRVKGTLALSKGVLRGGVGLGTGLLAAGMLRSISQKDRAGQEGSVALVAGIGAMTLSNSIFGRIVRKKIKLG